MASASFDKAVQHHRAGELDKAVALYRAALRTARGVEASRIWQMLGAALQQQGHLEQAEEALRTAIRCEPAPALPARQALAMFLSAQARMDEAIAAWREPASHSPAARLAMAQQMAEARRPEAALVEIQALLAMAPREPAVLFEHGRLCERLGRAAEARSSLEAVLAATPGQPESILLLARLDAAAGRTEQARASLEKLITELPDQRRGVAMIELARVLDKIGQHELAFEMARRGQAVNFASLPASLRDPSLHERVMDACLRITPEDVAAWKPPAATADESQRPAPVFIVGFPRSGTTLLEQMLSAHPNLVATDEFPILQRVRERLYLKHRPRGEYPQDLGAFTGEQVASARRWYLERASAAIGGERAAGRRIVDKQPLNTVDLAFIRLIFPDSPVVFVRRDPRDTVLSCFMQGFARGVPYLFSLEGAAHLHQRFMAIWSHYQRALGLRFLEVEYEELARQPEAQIRRVLAFIGEAWDPRVMQSHEAAHRRYVTTPSYGDVTQPVHTRAIGRWEKYRVQLQPVMERLAGHGGHGATTT